jgi:hypothetical protein
MANTIGTGAAGNIPFYNTAGTDLIPATGVSYDKTNKIFNFSGFNITKSAYAPGYGFSGMSFQNFYAGQPVSTFNFVRGRGTAAAKAVPLSGDQLANIVIAGWGGTTPVVGAQITASLVGTANATSMPTEIAFATNNGTALANRVKITKDGQLNVDSISNFSGSNLTLAPAGQVVLGTPSKVKITGGTAGQTIVTDGNGNLTWATINSGGGTQTSTIVTSVGNIALDFDINGDNAINSADALAFARFVTRAQPTGPVLDSYAWMKGDWSAGKGHAVIAVVEGNSTNALKVAVGLTPDIESGDTIFIGNTTSAGRASSGFGVNGYGLSIQAFDPAAGAIDPNGNPVGASMSIVTSTNGVTNNPGGTTVARGEWQIKGDVKVSGQIISSVGITTKEFFTEEELLSTMPRPANGTIVLVGSTFYGYVGGAAGGVGGQWIQLNQPV